MGLSNRLLAPRARRVCLAFPIPGRDGERYVVTGRPVPPRDTDRAGARAALGIGADERCVLVFGGSLGARSLNHAAVAAFADAPYRVLHVAGRRDFADLRAPGPHYDLRDYLVPFGPALAAADLAVARAGGSIFELAQYGLPAVLVPYPHATGRPPDRERALDGGGRRGGRRSADDELTPQRPARRGRRDRARSRTAARDGGRVGAARPPATRRATSPAPCSPPPADRPPRVQTPFVQSRGSAQVLGPSRRSLRQDMWRGRSHLSDSRGFTMVELLVVLLILGILALIALPSFIGQRAKAHDTEAQSTIRSAQMALRDLRDRPRHVRRDARRPREDRAVASARRAGRLRRQRHRHDVHDHRALRAPAPISRSSATRRARSTRTCSIPGPRPLPRRRPTPTATAGSARPLIYPPRP